MSPAASVVLPNPLSWVVLAMHATTLSLLAFMLFPVVGSCAQSQAPSTSKVFRSETYDLSFGYPSRWEQVDAQAKTTLVLLYARDGSLATCNLSVIPSDRQSVSDFDEPYFLSILSKIHKDCRIKRTWQQDFVRQNMAFAEGDFTMVMPERTVEMSCLVMATIQNEKRFMMILNAPRERLSKVRDDFDIMVSTLLFSPTGIEAEPSRQIAPAQRPQSTDLIGQEVVELKLEGKGAAISLLVPSEFLCASTQSEIVVRDRILAALNSNPGRRTRYSDWMVYDWKRPESMPWLMVASVGGLIKRQGTLSPSDWGQLKAELLSLRKKNVEASLAAVEKRIRDGAKIDYELSKREITDIFADDAHSVTSVVDLVAESEFGSIDAWAAMKMLYTDRSVATVYVYVPKEHPGGLRLLRGLAERVTTTNAATIQR